MQNTFLAEGALEPPDGEEKSCWERRLEKAVAQLRSAGIRTAEAPEALNAYVSLRTQWNGQLAEHIPSGKRLR
jgi:hypothetical protein